MKRFNNLYEKIYSMDNLLLAHQKAKRGKGWYKEIQIVDQNLDYYLTLLQKMLINQTYKTSKYQIFEKQDNKKTRLIYKLPYFPDRICHWAVLLIIEPYLIRAMTADTYSAIPNRGIHQLKQKIETAIRRSPQETQYTLKFDIKKYYPSINHEILEEKYHRIFKDKKLLWLLNEIIDSTKGTTGIPIGNYLSQYSGNLYLSQFDHWIKEDKRIKYYYRYMDDIVILHSNKEYLHTLKKEIELYLLAKLDLKIKSNWQIFPTDMRGIDFVGYRIFKDFSLLRKSITINFKNKCRFFKKHHVPFTIYHKTLASYYGWLIYCDSYRLRTKYMEGFQ